MKAKTHRLLTLISITCLLTACVSKAPNNKEQPKTVNDSVKVQVNRIDFSKVEYKTCSHLLKKQTTRTSSSLEKDVDYNFYCQKEGSTYKLTLNACEDTTILLRLHQITGSSRLLILTDTVYRGVPKSSSSCTGRYGYRCRGPIYRSKRNGKNTILVIDERNQNFAGLVLKSFPLFIKEDAEEPYHDYLMNLVQDIYSLERNRKSEYHNIKRLEKYDELCLLLDEIDTSNTNYSYTNDTLLIDEIIFHQLDSLATLLKHRGLSPRPLMPANTTQRFHSQILNRLRVVLNYNISNKICSERFECYTTHERDWELKMPLGFQFYSCNNKLYQFSENKYIMFMPNDGFANRYYAITVWKKQDEFYELENILDTTLRVSIGEIEIENNLYLGEGKHLFIGTSSCGDGGYVWGSFWLSLFTPPDNFQVLYEAKRSGDENKNEYITHQLDTINKMIYLTKEIRYHAVNKANSVIKQDTIKYLDIIKNGE